MIKHIAIVLSIVSISLVALFAIGVPVSMFAAADASGEQIDIWWPTDGAHVSGTEPFKALLDGQDTAAYDLYWQVDGGQLNPMHPSPTDAPHMEADVDFANWTWHGSGPYRITFVAKENGAVVGTRSEDIYIGDAPATSVAAAAPAIAPAPAKASATPVTSAASPIDVASAAVAPSLRKVAAWWPTPNARIAGLQTFKAAVDGASLDSYDLYWQVDGGQLNPMHPSPTDAPHMEADVDVSGWSWSKTGTYRITFLAKDHAGAEIGEMSEQIRVNPGTPSSAAAGDLLTAVAAVSSAQAPAPAPASGMKLYVDPNSDAARQAAAWRSSNPGGASLMDVLAAQPTASWFGDWDGDIYRDVHALVSAAESKGAVPVMVAYNIPGRDCGSYSAGGAAASQYASWIGSFASAIGGAPAIVILEPDALAGISCLSSGDEQARLNLISQAVSTLKSHGNTRVYIDAGHSGWVDPATMASRLKAAGIDRADGFAVNTSNFDGTSDESGYGAQISQKLGGKHFVIDTSRNGRGSDGLWCNPPGRAIGEKPTENTGNPLVDAYLWIKTPGESDGSCNGGPSAGVWWPDYAAQLVRNAE